MLPLPRDTPRPAMWTPEQIRALRSHLGQSQTEFADTLGFTRYQSVSEIENGKRDAAGTVERLLDFLAERHGFASPTGETEPNTKVAERLKAATAAAVRALEVAEASE